MEIENDERETSLEPEYEEIEIQMENEPYLGGGGSSYSEGFGIDISDENEISVDTEEIQEKLVAGDNISIEDNVISAIINAGEFRELTEDDYNYDSDNDGVFDCIALWLLDSGIYHLKGIGGDKVRYDSRGDTPLNVYYFRTFIISKEIVGQNYLSSIYTFMSMSGNDTNSVDRIISYNVREDGSVIGSSEELFVTFIDTPYLRNYIQIGQGAPTSSTIGRVGTIYTNNINGDLYTCVSVSGSNFVWQKVGGETYTAGTNISISNENVISATDTTYSNFTGTDGDTDGTAGLVPAPLTTDIDKFLKSDGTWATAGGGSGVTVLTTDDYNYPINNPDGIALWLLDEGQYLLNPQSGTIKYYYDGTSYNTPSQTVGVLVLRKPYDNRRGLIIETQGSSSQSYIIKSIDKDGYNGERVFLSPYVIYNLTSTSDTSVLAASQGKVLKDLIDGLVISGAGAPTTSTIGTVGKLYEDTTNGKLYQCTAVSGSTYTWSEVGAGGGGGPTVVQTTGTSTTDVMSQDAVSSMIFDNPGTDTKIKIGSGASVSAQNDNMAIGRSASANGLSAVAIGSGASSRNGGVALGSSAKAGNTSSQTHALALGYNSQALGAGAIALGRDSSSTHQGEMNIGASNTSYGYNSSNYRLLSGVYDGQSDHDAVTVGQVNATIDAINTALSTNIPHIGA